jgi:hypothetical protein
MDFSFSQEKLNLPLDLKSFSFQVPPGVEVMEGQ